MSALSVSARLNDTFSLSRTCALAPRKRRLTASIAILTDEMVLVRNGNHAGAVVIRAVSEDGVIQSERPCATGRRSQGHPPHTRYRNPRAAGRGVDPDRPVAAIVIDVSAGRIEGVGTRRRRRRRRRRWSGGGGLCHQKDLIVDGHTCRSRAQRHIGHHRNRDGAVALAGRGGQLCPCRIATTRPSAFSISHDHDSQLCAVRWHTGRGVGESDVAPDLIWPGELRDARATPGSQTQENKDRRASAKHAPGACTIRTGIRDSDS